MDCSEHEVSGFRCVNRGHERFFVTHLAYENDVRIFTNGVLHPNLEVFHIHADLTLVDQALVFCVDEFDRVFERENMFSIVGVDPVKHRRDRRRFTRTGNTREQDHALVVLAKAFHNRGQIQAFEVRNPVVHTSRYQADLAKLLEHVDTETPSDTVNVHGVGKVSAAFVVKDRSVSFVEHREEQADHLFHFDRTTVQRLQRSTRANHRRLTNLQVQVRTFQFHESTEELVYFSLFSFLRETSGHVL